LLSIKLEEMTQTNKKQLQYLNNNS